MYQVVFAPINYTNNYKICIIPASNNRHNLQTGQKIASPSCP